MKQKSRYVLVFGLVLLAFAAGCKKKPAPVAAAAPPSPPPAPVMKATATLSANPTSIERGQSATLEWSTSNATTVRIEPEVGTVQASGTRSVRPNQSTTYRVIAEGAGGTADASARITVTVPPAVPDRPREAPPSDGTPEWPSRVKPIFFDYDSSDIRDDQKASFDGDVAFWMQYPTLHILIEGYCDERGSAEYNLGLGDRRANTLKDRLIAAGIAGTRIDTISYGKEKPICSDETEACWQRNRRGDFSIKK